MRGLFFPFDPQNSSSPLRPTLFEISFLPSSLHLRLLAFSELPLKQVLPKARPFEPVRVSEVIGDRKAPTNCKHVANGTLQLSGLNLRKPIEPDAQTDGPLSKFEA